jgi:hypothetical protein
MIGALWVLWSVPEAAAQESPLLHACSTVASYKASRACMCLFRMDAEAWWAEVIDDDDLSGTCFQVYEVMAASPPDPVLEVAMWKKAYRVAAWGGKGLERDDANQLVSFEEKIEIGDPDPEFVPDGWRWQVWQENELLVVLHTQYGPQEGYVFDVDGDNDVDLLVLLANGNVWLVPGPLSPAHLVFLQ